MEMLEIKIIITEKKNAFFKHITRLKRVKKLVIAGQYKLHIHMFAYAYMCRKREREREREN